MNVMMVAAFLWERGEKPAIIFIPFILKI